MYNINIITDIEDTIIDELKRLLIPIEKRLIFGKKSSVTSTVGKTKTEVVKPSVNVMCLAGNVIKTTMSRYEISLDIYVNIITTHRKDEEEKRHDLYPILTAILFHLSGRRFEGFTLEPKQNFEQRDCTELFLEYECVFTTKFIIPEKEYAPDLLGVVANYYADPANMPYDPADASDIITNNGVNNDTE